MLPPQEKYACLIPINQITKLLKLSLPLSNPSLEATIRIEMNYCLPYSLSATRATTHQGSYSKDVATPGKGTSQFSMFDKFLPVVKM